MQILHKKGPAQNRTQDLLAVTQQCCPLHHCKIYLLGTLKTVEKVWIWTYRQRPKALTHYRMFSDTNYPSVVSSYDGQTTIYTEGNRKYISVELQCGLMAVLKLTLANSFLVETSYVFTRWYQAPKLARFFKNFLRNKWKCRKNTLSCSVKRNSVYLEPHQIGVYSVEPDQCPERLFKKKKRNTLFWKKWNFTV